MTNVEHPPDNRHRVVHVRRRDLRLIHRTYRARVDDRLAREMTGVERVLLGDLYKAQIRQLARAVGVAQSILDKAPSADLWEGQTDEGELGFTYDDVDQVLFLLVDERYTVDEVVDEGFERAFVEDVWRRVKANHYKRTMPNIAKLSKRTIGHDFLYLRDWVGR